MIRHSNLAKLGCSVRAEASMLMAGPAKVWEALSSEILRFQILGYLRGQPRSERKSEPIVRMR